MTLLVSLALLSRQRRFLVLARGHLSLLLTLLLVGVASTPTHARYLWYEGIHFRLQE